MRCAKQKFDQGVMDPQGGLRLTKETVERLLISLQEVLLEVAALAWVGKNISEQYNW